MSIAVLQEFVAVVARFRATVRAQSAVNVNDSDTKNKAIDLASTYFHAYRAQIVEAAGESELVLAHDRNWQDLIRLAHGNSRRKSYLDLLRSLVAELRRFSAISIVAMQNGARHEGPLAGINAPETNVLSTLESLVPGAAACYRQGLLDLDEETRLSYRGTASEFREALRETLDYLAPDSDVISQPGFNLADGQTQPTMKQKAHFVLKSRKWSKSQRVVTEKAIDVVENLVGEVVRATYSRASVSAHLETNREEVMRIKRYVDTVLFDLLEVPDAGVDPARKA